MKRTALYEWHRERGARFTEFAGWDMPVQYGGIIEEHEAVRKALGVFDISHMGQVFVEGSSALDFLQGLCTNDISRCAKGKAMYSHLCNERGGVIDDIFVYCLEFPSRYLVVVNASTTEKDFSWMQKNLIAGCRLRNESDRLGMIAVQGPKAALALRKIFANVPERHQVIEASFKGSSLFICRTGYTGEDGAEIVAPNPAIPDLADKVLEAGREFGIKPCGLGARDTLRLEAGYLLYGNDVDDDHSPIEAGVSWVVKFEKGGFIGKEALAAQRNGGLKRKLSAFKLLAAGIPRHGFKILSGGKDAGVVTSGTFSPSLRVGIALGYLPAGSEGPFAIVCNGRPVPAGMTQLPFYAGSKN